MGPERQCLMLSAVANKLRLARPGTYIEKSLARPRHTTVTTRKLTRLAPTSCPITILPAAHTRAPRSDSCALSDLSVRERGHRREKMAPS
ncbi:hypothetical protein BaRGS_00017573 [Batillaria attramentaria]|uniref:Uncharacterized protein n=1 Tax=Batillaria attramentaria TaxID=370345 RepID=A0ABD0KVT2_9CAEN